MTNAIFVVPNGRAVLGPGYAEGWARDVPSGNLARVQAPVRSPRPSLRSLIGRRLARWLNPSRLTQQHSMRDRAVPRTGFSVKRGDSPSGSGDSRPYLRLVGTESPISGGAPVSPTSPPDDPE